jgi:hypothetical protein
MYDAAPAPLVPKLEILDLCDVAADSTEESFARMIASRWWSDEERDRMKLPGVVRLKRVILNNKRTDPQYEMAICPQLQLKMATQSASRMLMSKQISSAVVEFSRKIPSGDS